MIRADRGIWIALVTSTILLACRGGHSAHAPGTVRCPETFAAAHGTCDEDAIAPDCTYPEGTCRCAHFDECVATPQAARPGAGWECFPLVRPDGCPGVLPAADSPCTASHSCVYNCPESGGRCEQTAACMSGRWSITSGSCPG